MTIKRPDNLVFKEKSHSYFLDGVKLDGVSSVAKVGEDNVWGVASAWAWKLGYEGAFDVLTDGILTKDADHALPYDKDWLREQLKRARLTPWHRTKESQDRGTAIHDALEILAQKGEVPILDQFPEVQHGFVQGLCRWFLDYRPEFVATEVQVVSEKHSFAGRYDIRAKIKRTPAHDSSGWRDELLLIDLKTGKRVYPTSQYVQLAGYELASREMGYPETDGQYILNVHADGSYDFSRSTARMQDFLDYLAAYRTIKRIKEGAKSA